MAKVIKDLKALRVLGVRACYRHSGPKGPEEIKRRFFVFLSVVCDRLITNESGPGTPALQGLARERWRGKPARLRVWKPARALALR